MGRFVSLAVGFVAVAALSASAAQAPVTAICDGMVAQIRGNSANSDPLALLYKGDHPAIELAEHSEMMLDGGDRNEKEAAESLSRFVGKFNAADALRVAMMDYLEFNRHVDVLSLPGSNTHVATSSDGTARCASFLFFQTTRGQSQLLPDLPLKGEHDGENMICDGYGSDGYLARVGDVEAFLETWSGDNRHTFRVVPLVNGHWVAACTVEANFATRYSVSAAYVPKDGPVTEAEIKTVAAQIVEQRAAAKDPKTFHFGPSLSDRENESVRTMDDVISKSDRESVPAFGRERELQFDAIRDADSYPLILNNRTYLMRIGHGQLGCCFFSDPIVILYMLKERKPEPVASAFVERSQGTLATVTSKVSR